MNYELKLDWDDNNFFKSWCCSIQFCIFILRTRIDNEKNCNKNENRGDNEGLTEKFYKEVKGILVLFSNPRLRGANIFVLSGGLFLHYLPLNIFCFKFLSTVHSKSIVHILFPPKWTRHRYCHNIVICVSLVNFSPQMYIFKPVCADR